jgi:type I restriction enzyme S subunit
MKQGWEIKKLGEVCSINYGTRVVQKKDGGTIFPVYGGGGATFRMDKYNREDCLVVSRFAMSSQCVRYVVGKFFLNDSGLTIESNSPKLKQSFLDKYIIAYNDKIYSLGKGAAQRNLDIKALKEVSINYPPIAEQEKIVAELDCLSGIIEKKKQQLKELDNLAQSIFYEMFGEHAEGRDKWEIAKLGNVCKTTSGGTPSKGHPEYYEGGDIPWLRSGEVNKMNIHETELFITEEGLNNSSAKWFPKGTVVIAMYGATVGQVGILCNPMTTNQAICGIFPNDTFTPIYLYHFLLSKKPEYLEIATGGAQANISQNIVRDTVVSCPPLTLQQDFASKIESIEKQKELIAQSIKETETLFNSRMDYYFN